MTAPVEASTSRLDRILLHLGVLSQKMEDIKAIKSDQKDLELRTRALEQMQAGTKGSGATWLLAFQVGNTVLMLVIAAATLWAKGAAH